MNIYLKSFSMQCCWLCILKMEVHTPRVGKRDSGIVALCGATIPISIFALRLKMGFTPFGRKS